MDIKMIAGIILAVVLISLLILYFLNKKNTITTTVFETEETSPYLKFKSQCIDELWRHILNTWCNAWGIKQSEIITDVATLGQDTFLVTAIYENFLVHIYLYMRKQRVTCSFTANVDGKHSAVKKNFKIKNDAVDLEGVYFFFLNLHPQSEFSLTEDDIREIVDNFLGSEDLTAPDMKRLIQGLWLSYIKKFETGTCTHKEYLFFLSLVCFATYIFPEWTADDFINLSSKDVDEIDDSSEETTKE